MIQISKNIYKGDYSLTKNKNQLIENSINIIIVFCDIDDEIIWLCEKLNIKIIRYEYDDSIIGVLVKYLQKIKSRQNVFIVEDTFGKKLIEHFYNFF